jgi:protein-tyrosine phosphatase
MSQPLRVLFVCMGNICRSPTAEGVFRKLVAQSAHNGAIDIDSAGTHGYHEGEPPDPRSISHAAKRGIDISGLRARKIVSADFSRFDYVVAMDENNHRQLMAACPSRFQHKISLLMEWSDDEEALEVPDPYYGEGNGFEVVLDLVQSGCEGLLDGLADTLAARDVTENGAGSQRQRD